MAEQNKTPRTYFYFLFLLIGVLGFFTLLSFTGVQIKIGQLELKDTKIKQFFYPEVLPTAVFADSTLRDNVQSEPDTASQRFLLIGDSMLEFLRIRLNDYCRHNGHTMNTVIWYSSSTLWYGQCDTITHYIKKYEPTYIILVLGANELFIKDIISERQKYVKHILGEMKDLPYIWVGPPNWKDDTGINDLIVRNVGRKRYFPSKDLSYERTKDGAHPTRESAYKWMDSIAKFMYNDAMYKVIMEMPDTFTYKVPKTEIIQPKPPGE